MQRVSTRARFAWLALPVALAFPIVAPAQVSLSGANLTNPAADGSFTGTYWNTQGGDSWYNLYLASSATPVAADFFNRGNSSAASIDLALTPGDHIFYLFAQPGSLGNWAMNLFFNAVQEPGISVTGALGSSAFAANSAANTCNVAHSNCALPGSGSLSYSHNGSTVTLTQIEWNRAAADRVAAYSDAAGGGIDFAGSMTLHVAGPATSVTPEPATMALLGTGLIGMIGIRRRQRRKTQV